MPDAQQHAAIHPAFKEAVAVLCPALVDTPAVSLAKHVLAEVGARTPLGVHAAAVLVEANQ